MDLGFIHSIDLLAFAINHKIDAALRDKGLNLTSEHLRLLSALSEKDGVAQHELALTLMRDRSAITRLVDNLEKKNFVFRVPDAQDRRVNRLMITKEGRQAVRRSIRATKSVFSEISDKLSKSEYSDLSQNLEKLLGNMFPGNES